MLTNPNTLGLFDAEHRGDRARSCTTSARRSTTTAPTSTRSWASRGPATWASTSCTSTCTSRSPSRTAAAARASGPIAVSDRIEPYLPRPVDHARGDGRRASTSTTTGRSRSAGCAASRATTAASCAPTPTSARSAPRGSRTRRETAVLNANYLLARLRELGVAEQLPLAFGELCMHEFVLSGGADEARAADPHARPRQAPARPRLPPADGLLPAARRRGAARSSRPRPRRARRSTRSPRSSPRSCARPREDPTIARERALHDAGAPPRRGGRGQAPGHPPGAVGVRRRTPTYPVRAPAQASAIEIVARLGIGGFVASFSRPGHSPPRPA